MMSGDKTEEEGAVDQNGRSKKLTTSSDFNESFLFLSESEKERKEGGGDAGKEEPEEDDEDSAVGDSGDEDFVECDCNEDGHGENCCGGAKEGFFLPNRNRKGNPELPSTGTNGRVYFANMPGNPSRTDSISRQRITVELAYNPKFSTSKFELPWYKRLDRDEDFKIPLVN